MSLPLDKLATFTGSPSAYICKKQLKSNSHECYAEQVFLTFERIGVPNNQVVDLNNLTRKPIFIAKLL